MGCNCKKKNNPPQQNIVVTESKPNLTQPNQTVTDLTPEQQKQVNEIVEKINQINQQ
jgi:hypothetical protein